jgi:GntR family transcriptional regulator
MVSESGEFMHIVISKSNKEPIYAQITSQVKKQILSGKLLPGENLPSIRKLAKDLQVSVITTKKAYEELEREGFIEFRIGSGSFVTENSLQQLQANSVVLYEQEIDRLINELIGTGLSFDEVREIFEKKLRERGQA